MAKYNEQDNDSYLLENNLLGIKTYEKLEETESLVFSLRALELENINYKDIPITLNGLKNFIIVCFKIFILLQVNFEMYNYLKMGHVFVKFNI